MTKTRVALAVLLGPVLFSACTGSRHGGPPTENVLRIPVEAKITSLDPHRTTDVYSSASQALVYESLYQFHYLKRPQQPEPALAESLPKVSKDKKTLTISLKKGIYFQDDPCFKSSNGKGPEFNSADVIYYFERIANSKFASPMFGSFEKRIVGIDDFRAGKAKTVSGVKALDRYTVEINLLTPSPRFAYNFVDTHGAMVPKECVENLGDQFARHPVGTGPYKIIEANLSSKVVAVRNPTHRQDIYPSEGMPGDRERGVLADAGKQLPFADKIIYEVFTERQPQWLKFKSGELEFSQIPKDFIPTELKDGKPSPDLAKLGVQHFREPKSDVTCVIFNMEDSVWGKKKELRQAVALALDVPQMIHIQYSDQAIRAQSLLVPNSYGYNTKFKSRWSERNIEKAKELLVKAGYPGGKDLPPLMMPSNDGSTARQFDDMVTRQLAEVGIVLKSEPMTWPELDSRMRSKRFTIITIGYSSSVPDVDDTTPNLASRNVSPGPNTSNYSNPVMDKLIDEIETMENSPARLAKISKFQEIVDEDLPYVAMVHRFGNQFFQRWIKNAIFIDNSYIGSFAKYLKVETAATKK